MSKIILGAAWIALTGGLVVMVKPVSKLAEREAAKAYTVAIGAELAEGQTDADRKAAADWAYTRAFAREAILAWGQFTGAPDEPITTEKVDRSVIVDEDDNVLQPTPASIDRFMEIAEIHDAFDAAYVAPYFQKVIEKNVSSRLSTGSSASAETTTAGPASSSTASTAH